MYLKKLEIQGFKSFADKISLDFSSGITSVVGPNGSGKSNIADALRWVLGEQSARILRGSKMEDVIFAGTEHRKPLGFAEVTITLDNSDHSLPIEYTEVTIARRVFRSGESEYLINKTPCRLKDINELFLDTGIGKDGYSIIGQGRVDEILSTKSEDRRLIFEEASGIMKYKTRKMEAEKKLELTRQNLLRINDIISELEVQLEPLKQQSEAAKKYLSLSSELKKLEVTLFIQNIDRLKQRLQDELSVYEQLKQNYEKEKNKLMQLENFNNDALLKLKELDDLLECTRHDYFSAEAEIERLSSEIKVNAEKIYNLQTNNEKLRVEIDEISKKIDNFDIELEKRSKKIAYLNDQLHKYNFKLEESQKKLDEIIKLLDENEQFIEKQKAFILDSLDISSEKKTLINNNNNFIANIDKTISKIDKEIEALKLDKDKENMKKENEDEIIANANLQINKNSNQINSLKKRKQELENDINQLREAQNKIASDISYRQSRKKILIEMENNLEGYSKAVRNLLQATKANIFDGRGIHGALAQLIKTKSRYETAIEMALGSSLQNIVTEDEEAAKRAIQFLKQQKYGRATFLPLTFIKGRFIEKHHLDKVSQMTGFCGVASELVICDSIYNEIVSNLLGRVIIADNLDNAVLMAKATANNYKIVTLEGDVLNPGGAITGGSIDIKNTGLLSRAREIEDIENYIQDAQVKYDKINNQLMLHIKDCEETENAIRQLELQNRENEMIKVKAESSLKQIYENIKRISSRVEILKSDKVQLLKQKQNACEEKERLEKELQELEDAIELAKKSIMEYQEKNKDKQIQRDELHKEINDYKVSVASIKESIYAAEEYLKNAEYEKELLIKQKNKKILEIDKNNDEYEKVMTTNKALELAIEKKQKEKAGRTFEMDKIAEEKAMLQNDVENARLQYSETTKNINQMNEDMTKAEVKLAKIESEVEAYKNRMWDLYNITYSNAKDFIAEIENIAAAQRKINDIRKNIEELGPVNVSAIEDYVKTRERYEFMKGQKEDLEKSEQKLHKVITELTLSMKKQFVEQFNLINKNFNEVYNELFEGGKACLILDDTENVLECGIEIQVQPPGKKLQNMMLLSGGERAFTAIALLFAILRLRPAPFCILDEIEAALDDANVYRFSKYLRKYCKDTQFIVITHRKGTMEGSDMLYGVTMEEHGVSKVVSLKLEKSAG